ncbi:ML domain-containing protein [Ganoderma leucocontextum]|nr:ML domain-containing protein [Ganoderma leucocontextum]
MARFSLLFLIAAAVGGSVASPVQDDQKVLFPGVPSGKRWDWKDCGTDAHLVHINSIEVSPDPPARGQDLTITVDGVAKGPVEDGAYADVTVKAGIIRLLHKEFDVCEEARNANTTVQCPVKEGSHKVTQTVTLPSEIPPAQFTVNIRGYTEDDEDLVCMDLMMDFRIRPGSFLPW